jgi:hypothetical protein
MTPDEARQRAVEAAKQAAFPKMMQPDKWRAALDAYESAMWQPIETAPRDGTEVLTWDGESWDVARWTPEAALFHKGMWETEACGIFPTHWRPLPAGPGGGA